MNIVYKSIINLHVSREIAEDLLQLISEHYHCDSDIMINLKKELSPTYVYKIKCKDCSRTFKLESSVILSEDKINRGGICINCCDDYK